MQPPNPCFDTITDASPGGAWGRNPQLQVFYIFFGLLGSNGKSALLRWLEMVFGPQYNKVCGCASYPLLDTDTLPR